METKNRKQGKNIMTQNKLKIEEEFYKLCWSCEYYNWELDKCEVDNAEDCSLR